MCTGDQNDEGDIIVDGGQKKLAEPSIEVNLPEVPDLHALHCLNMQTKYRRLKPRRPSVQADKSSA